MARFQSIQRNDGSRILTDRINNRDYRESETPAETEWVPELYGMDCRLRTWNGQQYNGWKTGKQFLPLGLTLLFYIFIGNLHWYHVYGQCMTGIYGGNHQQLTRVLH